MAATLLETALQAQSLPNKASYGRQLALAWERAREKQKALSQWEKLPVSSESIQHRLHLLLQLQAWDKARLLLQQAGKQLPKAQFESMQAYLNAVQPKERH